MYYVPKSSILLAGTGIWNISCVACGFSSIKIDYSDYPKSYSAKLMKFIFFLIKYRYKPQLNRLFCCSHTCYCVNMVSVTSASRYITSALRYHPRYQSRSSMYIHGLIPRNFVELANLQFRLNYNHPNNIYMKKSKESTTTTQYVVT